MTLDADDLLARMRRDFPVEYELVVLRCQVEALTAENDQLKALTQTYDPNSPRQFLEPEPRHG